MIPINDRTDLAAIATLRAAGEDKIAADLLKATDECRGRVAAHSWLRLAIHRPRWIGGGLLRSFMLRAISDWAAARGASVTYVEMIACPPEGCLCGRCALTALADMGYRNTADMIRRGGEGAVRAGYRALIAGRGSPDEDDPRRLESAIFAVEHIAVSRSVDLEEWT